MKNDELCAKLKADGWVLYPDNLRPHTVNYFKRFDTPTRCHCNDGRPGIQLQVSISEFDGRLHVELKLYGELTDESWLCLTNYAYGEIASLEQITKTIPRLLAMWECANQANQTGRKSIMHCQQCGEIRLHDHQCTENQ